MAELFFFYLLKLFLFEGNRFHIFHTYRFRNIVMMAEFLSQISGKGLNWGVPGLRPALSLIGGSASGRGRPCAPGWRPQQGPQRAYHKPGQAFLDIADQLASCALWSLALSINGGCCGFIDPGLCFREPAYLALFNPSRPGPDRAPSVLRAGWTPGEEQHLSDEGHPHFV